MWKAFFYFSKADRRAIIVLTCLLVGLVVGCQLLGTADNDSALPTEESEEANRFLTEVIKKEKEENERYKQRNSYAKKESRITPQLAMFDPNTADSATFVRLGLPAFMARNILRYREKGGMFREPEDFSRIYGLTPEQFAMLKPYIHIGEAYRPVPTVTEEPVQKDSVRRSVKYAEGTIVDLNRADTSELKKIPGIGSNYARQIVAYRQRLGGFYSVAQLQELPSLPPDIGRWFAVEETSHPSIRINRWSVERLRQHPYLNFYQAKVIVEHRKKYGKLKSLSQLSLYEEFREQDLKRLAPYVVFD